MDNFLRTAAQTAYPLTVKMSGCCGCMYQGDLDFVRRGVKSMQVAEQQIKSSIPVYEKALHPKPTDLIPLQKAAHVAHLSVTLGDNVLHQ